MIHQKVAFKRTFFLFRKYISIEKSLFFKIFGVVIVRNIVLIPVPYLIQILINDYLNLNLKEPLILITIFIFFLILLYYLVGNVNDYLSEILERRIFIKNFHKTLKALDEKTSHVNIFQIPRFLEVAFVKKEIAELIKSVSQIFIVIAFGSIIISTYHPIFMIYSFFLIILTFSTVIFLYPRIILFASKVSDIKFRINEELMKISDNKENYEEDKALSPSEAESFFYEFSSKYLKNKSGFFQLIIIKSVIFSFLIAFSQGLFILFSGTLIFNASLSVGQFVAAEIVITYILSSIYYMIGNLEKLIGIVVSLDKVDSVITNRI